MKTLFCEDFILGWCLNWSGYDYKSTKADQCKTTPDISPSCVKFCNCGDHQ